LAFLPAFVVDSSPLSAQLEALGRLLRDDHYFFHTPTPLTHGRVLARERQGADALRDAFGWNRLVTPARLPAAYQGFLANPDLFAAQGDGQFRARVRFGTLAPLLLAHSGYPAVDADAVFFGPDTYRFAQALRALKDREPRFAPRSCADIGAGTGAGGLFCATLFPTLEQIALLDINTRAFAFAAANSALNGVTIAKERHSDILSGWEGNADLIIANPPYLVDADARRYRHGGGDWGIDLSLRTLEQALDHLSPVGRLVLYTGTPVVEGQDKFLEAARPILEARTRGYRYDETDPDVFGEELYLPPYDQADRIATIVLMVRGEDVLRPRESA
jgi:SAM-dependent methyltransferase